MSDVHPRSGSSELHFGAVLHVRFEQEVPWQVISHAHERPQVTLRHKLLPAQATLHRPAPQVRFLQL